MVQVHDWTLRVQNVSDRVNVGELAMQFGAFGPIDSVVIQSPGLAFINMQVGACFVCLRPSW